MTKKRIIQNTKLYLTRRRDGATLNLGEGESFEIYEIKGLGIGEMEKEDSGSALADGALWLGSKVTGRTVDIVTAWNTDTDRSTFTYFFTHRDRYDVRLLYNDENYCGSCVLNDSYEADNHNGRLYSGSDIELS